MSTWLFVPGNRPERFAKAVNSGADEVICDLEDAVPPESKAVARDEVVRWLKSGGSAWVRINAVGSPWYEGDVDALRGLAGLRGLVVPKAESPEALQQLDGPVIALIETALGVHHAYAVAACPAVHRLAFGSIDFAADIEADFAAEEDDTALLLARSTLVLASRVAGRPAPIDGVTQTLDDAGRVRADAARARRLGFGGKLCVHPKQIAPVAEAFRPDPEQVAWARAVLAGPDSGARALAGQMIDKPVLDRARRILAQVANDEEKHASA